MPRSPPRISRPPPGPGFDIDPATPRAPRARGLSASEKGLLALALFAILGAVAFVADVLAARDGQTPASGFDHLGDAPESGADPQGGTAAAHADRQALDGSSTLGGDPLADATSLTATSGSPSGAPDG